MTSLLSRRGKWLEGMQRDDVMPRICYASLYLLILYNLFIETRCDDTHGKGGT
jgi:hypothetical protein